MKGLCRKLLCIAAMLVVLPTAVFSIHFDTRLTGITTHPDFWAGAFPSSVMCLVGIDGVDILPENVTEVGIQIATGTLARSISQDPLTGNVVTRTSDDTLKNNRFYDVLYASWKMGMAQGIGWSEKAQNDLITLRFTFNGQWEVPMDPIMQSKTRPGHPFSEIGAYQRTSPHYGETLTGTPDLSGNKQLLSLSFDLYGKVNSLFLKLGQASGIATAFKFTWAPSWLNVSKKAGGVADFWKFWLYADGSIMLYQKLDDNGMNLWSLGLVDEFEMRVLGGKHVPEYAKTLKTPLWWYEPENMTFLARNTIKLQYYGQQFFGSCIPYMYAFLDFSYSGGKLNNTNDYKLDSVWAGTAGVHVELTLFGSIHLYYEIGRIFLYNGDNQAYQQGFRSSETIRVSVSLTNGEMVDWAI